MQMQAKERELALHKQSIDNQMTELKQNHKEEIE